MNCPVCYKRSSVSNLEQQTTRMGFAWANADTSNADALIWADHLDFFYSQRKEQELLIPLFLM